MTNDANARFHRINGEMLDTIDEELEMEIDDDRLAKLLTEIAEHPQPATLDRRVYFKELLRLQGELVKLQDWVVQQKLKVVIIFEGRDAAGKGGVIKRITQPARIRAAERACFADYRQRWPDYSPVGRAEWNHRMVNNMKRRKQKAPTGPSPPRARRLTRPHKRSAAMKRSGEWRSSMLTARSFAKL